MLEEYNSVVLPQWFTESTLPNLVESLRNDKFDLCNLYIPDGEFSILSSEEQRMIEEQISVIADSIDLSNLPDIPLFSSSISTNNVSVLDIDKVEQFTRNRETREYNNKREIRRKCIDIARDKGLMEGLSTCLDAREVVKTAYLEGAKTYGTQGGRGDAIRHCILAGGFKFVFDEHDKDFAKDFCTNLEEFAGNPEADKKMDLENNKVGFEIYDSLKEKGIITKDNNRFDDSNKKAIVDACKQAADEKRLVIQFFYADGVNLEETIIVGADNFLKNPDFTDGINGWYDGNLSDDLGFAERRKHDIPAYLPPAYYFAMSYSGLPIGISQRIQPQAPEGTTFKFRIWIRAWGAESLPCSISFGSPGNNANLSTGVIKNDGFTLFELEHTTAFDNSSFDVSISMLGLAERLGTFEYHFGQASVAMI